MFVNHEKGFLLCYCILLNFRSPLLQNLQESHLAKFNQLKTDLRNSYTQKLIASVCSKGFPVLVAILPLLNQLGAIFKSCSFILVTSTSLEYKVAIFYFGFTNLHKNIRYIHYMYIKFEQPLLIYILYFRVW